MIVKLTDLVHVNLTEAGQWYYTEVTGKVEKSLQLPLVELLSLFEKQDLERVFESGSLVTIDLGIKRSRQLSQEQGTRIEEAVTSSPTLTTVSQLLLTDEARTTFQTQLIKGLEKYGNSVDGNTLETYLEWLLHPLEESMDLLVYITKIRSLPEFKDSSEHTKTRMLELQRLASVLTNVLGKIFEEEKFRLGEDSD